ncbi:TPA: hypothetical protein ACKLWQ_000406 [Neisseria gonorrhoeae]|uniref:hypothetical protein n=1 Tax=Neisseria gonorrhoeae TaxID=485 RepID=UPI0003088A41|nr:hypothetical protein [Neisseria gonorrhoeae]
MTEQHFTEQTKALIDSLKTICANYGLGNDGNEFKIISQAFLYTNTILKLKKFAKKSPTSRSSSSIWILREKQRF